MVDDWEICMIAGDLKDARQTVQIERRSASFKDEAMGGDE